MKQNLLLLLGGPKEQMAFRLKKSLESCTPLCDYDVLFTGLRSEWEYLKGLLNKEGSSISPAEITFITSWDTWSNLVHTQHIWEKYEKVFIASSPLHIHRIKLVFSHLNKGENVCYSITGEKEVGYAKLSLWLYSKKMGCRAMSLFSQFIR
jgi:hypothetical protein